MSNASTERSFSALRRVKTFLRNTLTQEHLNHQLMLHAHKELTDSIDVASIARSFVSVNTVRQAFLVSFDQYLIVHLVI